jgi:hypothetical protein
MSSYQFNPAVEVWKAIPDFPGYQVSDHGRVRSFWKVGQRKWYLVNSPQRIMRPAPTSCGYLRLSLFREGKDFSRHLHFLVLLSFIGPRPNKDYQCCHNDGNRKNNFLINLRYDTRKNNEDDKLIHNTLTIGEHNGCSKLTENQIIEIRKIKQEINLSNKAIASIFNVCRENIGMIVRRQTWKHI